MATAFKGITLHEGFNDIGEFRTNITAIETPESLKPDYDFEKAPPALGLLFKFNFASGALVPQDYTVNFKVKTVSTEFEEYSLHPDGNGFIKVSSPLFPVVKTDVPVEQQPAIVRMVVTGPLEDRAEECYMQVKLSGSTYYTLIKDMCLNAGKLCVYNGTNYYEVQPPLTVAATCKALYVNKDGILYQYVDASHSWESLTHLGFFKIEFPDELIPAADGFYTATSAAGTISSGHLGSAPFVGYSASVSNAEPYLVNVDVKVFDPTGSSLIYTGSFANMRQGSFDYKVVSVDWTPVAPADTSPTISNIETISGTTFAPVFKDWLITKGLTTLDKLRKAGPITYINGYPTGTSTTQLELLQGHVDLYTLNPNATQNQLIIGAGYKNINKLADASKKVFLDAVVPAGVPLYRGAEIQELAKQSKKLSANMLSATLTDLQLTNPSIPVVSGSNFIANALSNAVNPCGCDDCKSSVSPFAYLMDLIKYAADRIGHTTTPPYWPGEQTLSDLIALLTDKFLQPFGEFSVDCQTLHDEYCRVRLVTEVLEKAYDIKYPGGLASLVAARKDFVLQVYGSLLNGFGTSITELRDVVATQPADAKIIAAQKLSDRLGIPLYVPTIIPPIVPTTVLTVDRIYLTFNGGSPAAQELTAANLEELFGFRNTERNVLTATPVSLFAQWQAEYLKTNVWRTQDYKFTSYSREGLVPTATTFNSNWKPIIDPDIMGWEDMTYYTAPINTAPFASRYSKDLWKWRKEDTDAFLKSCMGFLNRTSVDMNSRILRVVDRNIVSHVIDGDVIKIENPVSTWVSYNLLARSLNETNTDVILKKPTPTVSQPAMLQPVSNNPKMRYRRVVNVTGITGTTSVTLTFGGTVIEDPIIVGGYARLESSDPSTTPYQTSPSGTGPTLLSGQSFNLTAQTVSFTLGSAPSAAFLAGQLRFVYEAEVLLYTTEILYPKNVLANLFVSRNYTLLSPVPGGLTSPFAYQVWSTPTWTGISGADDYEKLKFLQQLISSGTATAAQLAIVTTNLRMTLPVFNRMMKILIMAEDYRIAMYTAVRPTVEELYELVSIFRASGRTQLRDIWLKEEIKYVGGGSSAVKIMLDKRYFWKTRSPAVTGAWDPSLQTIADTTGAITATDVPIIDPELLVYSDIVLNPEADTYRALHTARQALLDAQYVTYYGLISPYSVNGFTQILNHINTGNTATPFVISPYLTLSSLVADLTDLDVIKQKKAADVLWASFSISREDFLSVNVIKTNYELNDALLMPSLAELQKSVKVLVSAYKRKRLYRTISANVGWIEHEINGSFPNGVPVKYYNVLKMKMAPGRADFADKNEWQQTLEAWNRKPFVQPDLVPPENIKNFVSSDIIYTTWNTRKNLLAATYTSIAGEINASGTAGALFDRFQKQLDLIVARLDTTTPFSGTPVYLHYFTDIKTYEAKGEDIRPWLEQLGITITEYRFLSNIYRVLEQAPSGGTSPLIASEYVDVIDILIAIRSRNITYTQVVEEYDQNILLTDEFFKLAKTSAVNLQNPVATAKNKWRFNTKEYKTWKDTLDSRINRQKGVTEAREEVIFKVDDVTMPLMRDALITALRNSCESFEDASERLARTFFIETKDNCCVKHTRISFAIETIQGFIFAVAHGIFDNYIQDFGISAPNFLKEWDWIGSYASWRSAILTFTFPENLLYPTLKRVQSPAFEKLSLRLQRANSFSPVDACHAADEFQEYLNDVESIEIVSSATAYEKYSVKDPFDCCSVVTSQIKHMAYYFGQGPSGKAYWSKKEIDDNTQQAHGFWEELPFEDKKDLALLGSYVVADRGGPNWVPVKMSIFVFYTHLDQSVLKMGYLSKDLFKAGSEWQDNDTEELPKYAGAGPIGVTACQTKMDWMPESFIFSYDIMETTTVGTTKYVHRHHSFDHRKKAFNTVSIDIATVRNNYEKPITALRYEFFDYYSQNASSASIPGLVLVFKDQIFLTHLGYQNDPVEWNAGGGISILGVYESDNQASTAVVTYINAYGTFEVVKIEMIWGNAINVSAPIATANISPQYQQIKKIYPLFSERDERRVFAVKCYSTESLVSAEIAEPPATGTLTTALINLIGLVPEATPGMPVQSAECIPDLLIRQQQTRQKLEANTNAPAGTSVNDILRTTTVNTLLYEAYYFVPMLLALDQQKHGEFVSALSWYRSVYDYTRSAPTCKIFYGLELEESTVNSFTYASNWLLDPLNPHLIAQSRTNAYTRYTLMSIIQCLNDYADREFTMDTIETVPTARKLYTTALDLLKAPELNVKPSACVAAVECLDTQMTGTVIVNASPWTGLYNEMKGSLLMLGSPSLINGLTGPIVTLLNSGTEATYGTKFAESFALIEGATPTPPAAKTVTEVLNGSGARNSDAMRYMSAQHDVRSFNSDVRSNFSGTISSISGIPVGELDVSGSPANLTWLRTAVPNNDAKAKFSFANSSGVQPFNGSFVFDPTQPFDNGYSRNLVFSNAPLVLETIPNNTPPMYTPLMDYTFCVPENVIYKSLELKGNLELYKIFNCRNIAGMVRELDVFSAATDSTTGVPVIGASGNLSIPSARNFAPSNYRFKVLIERAKQIAAQAQQMESLFLAALEKEDNENYAQLQAKQSLQTARATVKLQDLRISQATNEKGVADLQVAKTDFMMEHYNELLSNGLSDFEKRSLENLVLAEVFQYVASGLSVAASLRYFYPPGEDFSIAQGLSALAGASSSAAAALSTQASILSQRASYERRAEEWRFQWQVSAIDRNIAGQQVKVAEDGVRIATQEKVIAELNVDHAQSSLDFLKNKFTNAELYNFMGNVLQRSYSYMLNLSTAMARTAESQLYFERQEQAGPFILNDYWEAQSSTFSSGSAGTTIDRRGLTGSARLLVDITRLDQYAFETLKRKLQMNKVISLANNFPSEFHEFKETGVLNFELTNTLFDYDFPGHYLRLINGIKTTVVGLLPVYDGIKATLTTNTISYTVVGGTTFQKIPIRRMEVDSVALTSPNNATGLFELQPTQGDLLNPFEGVGVESRWEFKMPQFSNRMDYSNIADILIDVEYTALDSYQYRYQVLQDLDNTLGFSRGFSFKNNFPDQWYELGEAQAGSTQFGVTIELKREMFPQGINDLRLDGTPIVLYFVREEGFTDEINVLDFNLANVNSIGGGNTNSGRFIPNVLMGNLSSSSSPVMNLRLLFDNQTPVNRELFSEGKIKDILILMNCKADLKPYPL